MRIIFLFIVFCISVSCSKSFIVSRKYINTNEERISGSQFYKLAATYNWKQRDSAAYEQLIKGNFPKFLRKFIPVKTSIVDDNGLKIVATFFVMPDYLSVGDNDDWARVPLTPMTAQKIADSLNCFLPTKKLVDVIYKNAIIKLQPQPMFIYRDSSITMWQHHLIIEGQRKNKQGLIAGIKKDVIITSKLLEAKNANKVAIYGWHKLDGMPIQNIYVGHLNWYVDYSHGIRLIYRKIKVNNQWMDYEQLMKDPLLKKLICEEEFCGFLKY